MQFLLATGVFKELLFRKVPYIICVCVNLETKPPDFFSKERSITVTILIKQILR